MGSLNKSEDTDTLLRQKQQEILNLLLPDVICLTVFTVVGAIGNVLAAVFYKTSFKRTTTMTLIISLTLNDFIVCLLFIPNIVEIELNVNNSYSILCKITHFLNQWFIGTSCILLWVISIDRYRRICKPFGKQISTRSLKYVIPCASFLSLCVAVRKVVDYDTIEIEIHSSDSKMNITGNISGSYCTNTDNPDLRVIVSSFFVIDVIFVSTTWITIIVAYSNAIRTLMYQKQKKKNISRKFQLQTISRGLALNESEGNQTYERNVIRGCADQVYGMDFSDDNLSDNPGSKNDDNNINASLDTFQKTGLSAGSAQDIHDYTVNHSVSDQDVRVFTETIRSEKKVRTVRKKPIVKNISALEQSLTFMMFTASAVFLLSFAPFFIIKLYMSQYSDDIAEYELRPGVQFALKLPLVNSVFTPIIYCIFNSKFRKFLKPSFCRFRKIT
ncbi:cholecystokinin receptor type A-like [Ruditapes philippinarum]|uniref:cholecystokinin receptor type A-like n=1 Tax=Ruditapes philippinarum TaxID=129788 RepID=UPI00295AA993|nr:cholecystokinin receptor type A-like [Ruditapes philippinarum]